MANDTALTLAAHEIVRQIGNNMAINVPNITTILSKHFPEDSDEQFRHGLKQAFPWLGTDEPVSGADVVDRLNELYAADEQPEPTAPGPPTELVCPHCQSKQGDNTRVVFYYIEDIQNHRDVVEIVTDGETGGEVTLLVAGHYETGEGYDDGDSPRLLCRNCVTEFPVPAGLAVDFV